jgi:hypothetical protein
MKRLTILLAIVLLGSLCHKKPPPQQELIKKRAEQLIYEYRPDIAAGDAKYKGKELLVKGKILKAEPDNGMVMLKGTISDIYPAVICHFQDDETREAIRQAFENLEIIVQGVNTGYSHDGVHLRPCRISKDQ